MKKIIKTGMIVMVLLAFLIPLSVVMEDAQDHADQSAEALIRPILDIHNQVVADKAQVGVPVGDLTLVQDQADDRLFISGGLPTQSERCLLVQNTVRRIKSFLHRGLGGIFADAFNTLAAGSCGFVDLGGGDHLPVGGLQVEFIAAGHFPYLKFVHGVRPLSCMKSVACRRKVVKLQFSSLTLELGIKN